MLGLGSAKFERVISECTGWHMIGSTSAHLIFNQSQLDRSFLMEHLLWQRAAVTASGTSDTSFHHNSHYSPTKIVHSVDRPMLTTITNTPSPPLYHSQSPHGTPSSMFPMLPSIIPALNSFAYATNAPLSLLNDQVQTSCSLPTSACCPPSSSSSSPMMSVEQASNALVTVSKAHQPRCSLALTPSSLSSPLSAYFAAHLHPKLSSHLSLLQSTVDVDVNVTQTSNDNNSTATNLSDINHSSLMTASTPTLNSNNSAASPLLSAFLDLNAAAAQLQQFQQFSPTQLPFSIQWMQHLRQHMLLAQESLGTC